MEFTVILVDRQIIGQVGPVTLVVPRGGAHGDLDKLHILDGEAQNGIIRLDANCGYLHRNDALEVLEIVDIERFRAFDLALR